MKHLKSLMEKVRKGEGGFTLIELLIVIAILGVIAAVVILNVGGFFGTGTVESANTELHQAQTAIVACMADSGASSLNNVTEVWWGGNGTITAGGVNGTDAASYIYGMFKAGYTVASDGSITDATLETPPTGITAWDGITWDSASHHWVKSETT
mgnify:CR=1 FL=1